MLWVVMRLAVGIGAGRGWSAREGMGGMGQEVVMSWRTVEKSDHAIASTTARAAVRA